MFTKQNVQILAIAVFLGLLFVFYYAYIYEKETEWTENYSEEKDEPYSTSIIYSLLEDLSNGNEITKVKSPLREFLPKLDPKQHYNYIFLGNFMSVSQADADSLINFVKAGNSVFISANNLPNNIGRRIFFDFVDDADAANNVYEDDYDEDSLDEDSFPDTLDTDDDIVADSSTADTTNTYGSDSTLASVTDSNYVALADSVTSKQYLYIEKEWEDSVISFRFTHLDPKAPIKTYKFNYLDNFKPKTRTWKYINDTCQVNDSISKMVLGYLLPNNAVFYRYKIGKGEILLHTVPLTFTNLYLKQRDGFEYANQVFSHLKPGNVLWDKYNNIYRNDDSNAPKSPIAYILSQPALRWAWYLSLVGILLYFLFYSKRRQRIIPIKTPLENTTIEFVQTLAQFYKKGGDAHIVEIKEKNWRIFIWERYKIKPNLPDQEYISQVSLYSGLPAKTIGKLIEMANYLKKNKTNPPYLLLDFDERIQLFYTNCK